MFLFQFVIYVVVLCLVEIKWWMIDWWGLIIFEYYGSIEGIGVIGIIFEEWLCKLGLVGCSVFGLIYICDEDGIELFVGEFGLIYFEVQVSCMVNYLNDLEKIWCVCYLQYVNWVCVGDIGKFDEDGYLFFIDCKDFMIILGGVNIYL